MDLKDIRESIRTVPDFPKKGVMFRDITTLVKDYRVFSYTIERLADIFKDDEIDVVVGIESRGFIIGAPLALELKAGFVPVRKPGKLPYETVRKEYQTEYSLDAVEMHVDAIQPGQRILMVDDLIATGGTMKAAVDLVEQLGGGVVAIALVVDLPDLHGKEMLKDYRVVTLVEFEGE
jgi:adenine phosphoribosyltransferase